MGERVRWGLNIWITSKVVWAVPSNFPKEGLGFGGDEREPNCFMWERRTKGGEAEKKKDTGKMPLEEGVPRMVSGQNHSK